MYRKQIYDNNEVLHGSQDIPLNASTAPSMGVPMYSPAVYQQPLTVPPLLSGAGIVNGYHTTQPPTYNSNVSPGLEIRASTSNWFWNGQEYVLQNVDAGSSGGSNLDVQHREPQSEQQWMMMAEQASVPEGYQDIVTRQQQHFHDPPPSLEAQGIMIDASIPPPLHIEPPVPQENVLEDRLSSTAWTSNEASTASSGAMSLPMSYSSNTSDKTPFTGINHQNISAARAKPDLVNLPPPPLPSSVSASILVSPCEQLISLPASLPVQRFGAGPDVTAIDHPPVENVRNSAPDIITRSSEPINIVQQPPSHHISSDRNLFMETGQLDEVDEPLPPSIDRQPHEVPIPVEILLPLDRLVLGSSGCEQPRVVPGGMISEPRRRSISDALLNSVASHAVAPAVNTEQRSEAAGSEDFNCPVPVSMSPPSIAVTHAQIVDVSHNDHLGTDPTRQNKQPRRNEFLSSDECEDVPEIRKRHESINEAVDGRRHKNKAGRRLPSESEASLFGESHRQRRYEKRLYQDDFHPRESNRRRRQEYDEDYYYNDQIYQDSRRSNYKYQPREERRYNTSSLHRSSGERNKYYHVEETYRRDHRRHDSHRDSERRNRSYVDSHISRPSSRCSVLPPGERSSFVQEDIDSRTIDSFRKNWDYYSRRPAAMEALRISNPVQHANLLRYYALYSHLLVRSDVQETIKQSENKSLLGGEPENVHRAPSSEHREQVILEEELTEHKPKRDGGRLTPVKFVSPHICAVFGPLGNLATVQAKFPADGQVASVLIQPLCTLTSNLSPSFPGPLMLGSSTRKSEVIKFCRSKIDSARHRDTLTSYGGDFDSYILIWELMILLLRQKNAIDGTDISELLLKDSKEDLQDEASVGTSNNANGFDNLNIFRQYLLQGCKKEGLEFAMSNGLWGHALFLANKMNDEHCLSMVMHRFLASAVPHNDPLQTLYKSMSGHQLSIPMELHSSSGGSKWNDWRPHLAMILANPTHHPDMDTMSILTLGDNLYEKGRLYAAHFCYLMANVSFGAFRDASHSRLLLLGSDHRACNLKLGRTSIEDIMGGKGADDIEALQLTEVYEYVQRLSDPSHTMAGLQLFKFVYSLRLLDHGYGREALRYLESIAGALERDTRAVIEASSLMGDARSQISFLDQVCCLADRLRLLDPYYSIEGNETTYPDWLTALFTLQSQIQQQYNNVVEEKYEASSPNQVIEGLQNELLNYDRALESSASIPSSSVITPNTNPTLPEISAHIQPVEMIPVSDHAAATSCVPVNSNHVPVSSNHVLVSSNYVPVNSNHIPVSSNYVPANSNYNPPMQQPNWSHNVPQNSYSNSNFEQPAADNATSPTVVTSKSQPKSGLFGRLLGYVGVKAQNQIHLPDDKDNAIVWDEATNSWIDRNADVSNSISDAAGPPQDISMPPSTGGGNRFMGNLSKRKGGLSGRIDVYKNIAGPTSTETAPLFFNPSNFTDPGVPPTSSGLHI